LLICYFIFHHLPSALADGEENKKHKTALATFFYGAKAPILLSILFLSVRWIERE